MIKKAFILSLVTLLLGCDTPLSITEEVTNRFSGHINDIIVENHIGGTPDNTKKLHLDIIKKGILELEAMNDPNISEIYKTLDKHLSDNDMSMYDYQSIASVIQKHKAAIAKQQSNHKNDVKDFRKNLT